jgi:cyclase
MTCRIIPRLDIKGPNLVKGIHLEGLRILGKPEAFAKHYYEQGADELIYMDIVASLYERNSLAELISTTAQQIFIPLTVGGGLRSLKDIETVLGAGADKVAINTAAIRNPDFIKEAAEKYGSSTIIVSIEAIKKSDGSYEAFTDNGREETGLDVFEWAKRAANLGAGEILITSVDREGTGFGFDLPLVKKMSESVSIPVIALGGGGRVEHVHEVITKGKADAVSIASLLHYDFIRNHDMLKADYSNEGNIDYLKSGKPFSNIQPLSMIEIKRFLINTDVACRPVEV